ncbi:MAG: SGNH/GDSL hydrolase family protein [Victivallales bacterium]|nr:SGNH/GDSL hydrolase family protein [Victivallales bacterium]
MERKLFFFGDSICFGQGVSPHKTWVTRTAAKLNEEMPYPVVVANPSINGNTTRMALERMPFDVQSHNPDIVVVQFGLNDCNFWLTDNGMPRVSAKAFIANMEEIVERCFKSGAKFVLVNTNHPTTRDKTVMPNTSYTYQQHNKKYNELLRNAFCNYDSRVLLIDIEQVFEATAKQKIPLEKLLLDDELHLSEQGHDVYYQTVLPAIKKTMIYE